MRNIFGRGANINTCYRYSRNRPTYGAKKKQNKLWKARKHHKTWWRRSGAGAKDTFIYVQRIKNYWFSLSFAFFSFYIHFSLSFLAEAQRDAGETAILIWKIENLHVRRAPTINEKFPFQNKSEEATLLRTMPSGRTSMYVCKVRR